MVNNLIRSTLFIIVLLLLSACGTLEVGVESGSAQLEAGPTPTFDVMMLAASSTPLADNAPLLQTPTPVPVSSGMLELVPYIHPELGYEIAIPNGATIDEEISATNFLRLNSDGHLLLGVFVVVNAITDFLEWG